MPSAAACVAKGGMPACARAADNGVPRTAEPGGPGEAAQMVAKGAEQLEGVLTLLEQAVEQSQRLARLTVADQLEDLEGLLGPAIADQRVDVG